MKASIIREMSFAEIRERIDNERNMLHKLKMSHSVSTLENPMKIKFARRSVARLLTELAQREKKEAASIEKPKPSTPDMAVVKEPEKRKKTKKQKINKTE